MTTKHECGVFCCHPPWLQKCGSIGFFVFFASMACLVSQSAVSYLSTQLTALERQFGFSSTQTGLLLSCNDIGFTVFVLLMGYLAPKVHIPKVLGFCLLLFGLSALICTVPYFVSRDEMRQQSLGILSELPDVATIQMLRQMQRQNANGFIPTEPSVPSSTTNTSSEASKGIKIGSEVTPSYSILNSSTVSKVTENMPSSTTPKPAFSPFTAMLAKFRSYVGDAAYFELTGQAGIKEGVTPGLTSLKKLVKIVAANATILEQIPPSERARLVMFARISKRSPEPEREVSDLGELNPFHLMILVAPRCSAAPKPAQDCDMVAKLLNRGLQNSYTGLAFALLATGMVLMGIAKSSRLPMTLLYFDDNGSKLRTPLYLGYLLTAAMLGSAVAIAVGVLASYFYVTMDDVPFHRLNPHWIGAWWIGYIVIAIGALLTSLPLMYFPKRLRPRPQVTSYNVTFQRTPVVTKKTGFLVSVKRCLTNPVLLGLTFCGVLVLLMVAGILPFLPKYLETQFSLPAWQANLYVGGCKLVPGFLGSIITGVVVTKKKLSPLTMLKLALGCGVVLVVSCGLGHLLGCDTVNIVGLNEEFKYNNRQGNSSACSSSCYCDTLDYFPVCGSDGRNYFSPCHAGCLSNTEKMFTECSCIGADGTASLGLCTENSCKMLGPYLALCCVIGYCIATITLLGGIVALRSVADKDRSSAIALGLFLANLLGWLPAPIIFGKLVDSACILWRKNCDHLHTGACTVYDIGRFRAVQHTYFIGLAVLTVVGLCFTLFKARNKTDWNSSTLVIQTGRESEDKDGEPSTRASLMYRM